MAGILGLPPGLRGYVAGEEMENRRGQNTLGMLGGVMGLQNQMAQQQQMAQMGPLQLQLLQAQIKKAQQGPAPIAVSPGASLIDPTNPSRSLFTAPATPVKPSNLGQLIAERDAIPQGDPRRTTYDQAITRATTHQPPPNVQTSVNVPPPGKVFENENKLRDDYVTTSKPFVGLRDAYNTVNAALAGPITAASTLAGATKFMKLIDPESVVRESELNLALKSTGLLDRFLNLHNTVMKGQVLTPNQASEIKRMADALYGAAEKQQAQTDAYFSGLAKEYGLEPRRVIRNQKAVMKNDTDLFDAADAIVGQ